MKPLGYSIQRKGYVTILLHRHPRANNSGHVLEHIVIAEKILGKFLPKGAEIHHINEVRWDNRPENLVICQDEKYHKLIHRRLNAFKACGNPNWRKCRICGSYDSKDNMYKEKKYGSYRHRLHKNGIPL